MGGSAFSLSRESHSHRDRDSSNMNNSSNNSGSVISREIVDTEKEVLRGAFAAFLAATTKEEFSARCACVCSMLEYPRNDQELILGHLEKFHPYLLAMSVFDSFSVDLSSRFENLLFPGTTTTTTNNSNNNTAPGSNRNTTSSSNTIAGNTDGGHEGKIDAHSSLSPALSAMNRKVPTGAPDTGGNE